MYSADKVNHNLQRTFISYTPASLSIHLSLSLIASSLPFPPSSSVHLFPLTYPQYLFSFISHPSPICALIHPCSSALIICFTLSLITHALSCFCTTDAGFIRNSATVWAVVRSKIFRQKLACACEFKITHQLHFLFAQRSRSPPLSLSS